MVQPIFSCLVSSERALFRSLLGITSFFAFCANLKPPQTLKQLTPPQINKNHHSPAPNIDQQIARQVLVQLVAPNLEQQSELRNERRDKQESTNEISIEYGVFEFVH